MQDFHPYFVFYYRIICTFAKSEKGIANICLYDGSHTECYSSGAF